MRTYAVNFKIWRNFFLFVFTITFIFVSGCTKVENFQVVTPIITNSPIPAPTLTPTSILPQKKTPTSIPQPTRTKDEGIPRTIKCFSITNSSTIDKPVGTVVFSGEFYQTPSYLLDTYHGNITPIEQQRDEKVTGFTISKDHKWLAFQKINVKKNDSKIVIMDSDGTVLKNLGWDPSWRKIGGWVDNQTLLISKNRGKNEIDSIIRINPFTEKQSEIAPNYPDMWIVWVENVFSWGSFNTSGVIYNATFNRAIYPIRDEQKSGIVLWNLDKSEKITSLYGGFGNQPKWRPNEDGFLVNLSARYTGNAKMNEEFFYIDKTGKITQITDFNNADGNAKIGFFNWSLDGNFIAFWLSLDPVGNYPDIYPSSPVGYSNRLAVCRGNKAKPTEMAI
jgi:hypothetical protein